MLYRRRADLIQVTLLVVIVTLVAMGSGVFGASFPESGPPTRDTWATGPVSGTVLGVNDAVNGEAPLWTVEDPTNADPRVPPVNPDTGERPTTPNYDAATGAISVWPSFLLWSIFLLAFAYLGTNMAIWRFAQPVNYIGFWIMALTIGLSAIGAVLAPFTKPAVAAFQINAFNGFAPEQTTGAIQTLWPMLFVTIACGAISGWHALFGSVGTARQLEYETDALPVGGGGMFSENTLGLLSLTAVAIVGAGAGAGAFAGGVGRLIHVASFQTIPLPLGTALGFGAFVVIVLTVVQLVFRVMRVTLAEWLGERWVGVKNQHVASVVGMAA